MTISDEEYKKIFQETLGKIDDLEWSGKIYSDDEVEKINK